METIKNKSGDRKYSVARYGPSPAGTMTFSQGCDNVVVDVVTILLYGPK